MYDFDKFSPKIRIDKNTRLITYAHFEIRALKSALLKSEIKELRNYLSKDFDRSRNIYGFITGSEISNRTFRLTRECAALVYPFKGLKKISHPAENSQKTIYIGDLNDDNTYTYFRIYYTALELVFMRATFEELRAIIAFLVDDTRKLEVYDFSKWVYRDLDFVYNNMLFYYRIL